MSLHENVKENKIYGNPFMELSDDIHQGGH